MSARVEEYVHLVLVGPASGAGVDDAGPVPVGGSEPLGSLVDSGFSGEFPGLVRGGDADGVARDGRWGRHFDDVDFLAGFVVRVAEGPARVDEAERVMEGDDGAVDGPLVFGHAV